MLTLEKLYDRSFDEESMRRFIEERRVKLDRIENSRDVVLGQVGEELYELFVRHYTRKQWGLEAGELDPSVLRRVPLRFDRNPDYFTDPHQGIPKGGYTAMIRRMLDHPDIHLLLSTPYEKVRNSIRAGRTLYTGRLDEFYGFRFGELPYRSLHFRYHLIERERVFPAGVINFPGKEPFTRVSEYKTIYQQQGLRTTLLAAEYPRAEGEPFYPSRPENQARGALPQLASMEPTVISRGRLGGYRYLNRDQRRRREWKKVVNVRGERDSGLGTW
jgi:UDP-galactopyranose mutase